MYLCDFYLPKNCSHIFYQAYFVLSTAWSSPTTASIFISPRFVFLYTSFFMFTYIIPSTTIFRPLPDKDMLPRAKKATAFMIILSSGKVVGDANIYNLFSYPSYETVFTTRFWWFTCVWSSGFVSTHHITYI